MALPTASLWCLCCRSSNGIENWNTSKRRLSHPRTGITLMATIRPYRKDDRAAVEGLGLAVIDWWNEGAALHLVAGDPPVAHLQAVDLNTVSARRPGQCHMRLIVAPAHRGLG